MLSVVYMLRVHHVEVKERQDKWCSLTLSVSVCGLHTCQDL